MIATRRVHMHQAVHKKSPLLSVEWPHKETKCLIGDVIHKQEGGHKVPKSVLREVLGRMKFTLHATRRTRYIAEPLVKGISAGLVETRRAPSQQSRDVRVYGYMTTAMHN